MFPLVTGCVRALASGQIRAAQYSADVWMPAAPVNPKNDVRSSAGSDGREPELSGVSGGSVSAVKMG